MSVTDLHITLKIFFNHKMNVFHTCGPLLLEWLCYYLNLNHLNTNGRFYFERQNRSVCNYIHMFFNVDTLYKTLAEAHLGQTASHVGPKIFQKWVCPCTPLCFPWIHSQFTIIYFSLSSINKNAETKEV